MRSAPRRSAPGSASHGRLVENDVGDADDILGNGIFRDPGWAEMPIEMTWNRSCGEARISASIHEATPPRM